jgi:fatty acid desaturase
VSGILVTVAALIIEIFSIYFQTDPGVNYTGIIDVLIVLGITGAVLFAGAFWEWKQEVNDFLVLILIVIGLVGFSTSARFHNALVDAFFPRTSISVFLGINFMAIAMVGVFLLIFRRLPPPDEE